MNTKDSGQLSIQIDACADRIPSCMMEIRRQSNEAIKRGDLDSADRLDEILGQWALLYQTILRHRIRAIDDSQEMRDAIVNLTKINKSMDDIMTSNESGAAFLTTVANILNGLGQMAGKVLA